MDRIYQHRRRAEGLCFGGLRSPSPRFADDVMLLPLLSCELWSSWSLICSKDETVGMRISTFRSRHWFSDREGWNTHCGWEQDGGVLVPTGSCFLVWDEWVKRLTGRWVVGAVKLTEIFGCGEMRQNAFCLWADICFCPHLLSQIEMSFLTWVWIVQPENLKLKS